MNSKIFIAVLFALFSSSAFAGSKHKITIMNDSPYKVMVGKFSTSFFFPSWCENGFCFEGIDQFKVKKTVRSNSMKSIRISFEKDDYFLVSEGKQISIIPCSYIQGNDVAMYIYKKVDDELIINGFENARDTCFSGNKLTIKLN